jgi:hypothetical protein
MTSKDPHGPYRTSSGCSSRMMSPCPPSSRLPMRMTTPHSMIPPDMLGRPASVRRNFATRPERPAKIPTSTSSEIRNYITQEEQHSLRTSLSELQAGLQRFCAAISVLQAKNQRPQSLCLDDPPSSNKPESKPASSSTPAVKMSSSHLSFSSMHLLRF